MSHSRRVTRIASTILFVLASTASLPAVTGAQDGKRPISETDLLRFVWIADPQISPDGTRVAFVRVTVNEKRDAYETSLWLVPASGEAPPRRITSGTRDNAPRWSPDGRRLAFLRGSGESGPPQIFLLETTGGEAYVLTDMPKGCSSPAWSPDGKALAFLSTTRDRDFEQQKREGTDGKPEAGAGEKDDRESDVRVITRAAYRANGAGYIDPERRAHIWTIAVPPPGPVPSEAARARRVTSGPFDEQAIVWSADGARIFFASTRVLEPYYEPAGAAIYSVPASGGEPSLVAEVNGALGGPVLSPDGARFAAMGSLIDDPVRSYNQPDLFLGSVATEAAPRNLTAAYDRDIGGGISGDQRAPRGSLPAGPVWTRDGRSILAVTAEHGASNLVAVDTTTGRVQALTSGNHEIVSYTATPDAGKLVVLISTPANVGDLFVIDLQPDAGAQGLTASRPRQITRMNEELFKDLALGEPEEIWYESFDRRRIQGWILKPPGFDPSRRYPLILQIHGGPHAAYGSTFTHEFAWMAARGYVVLYTNPRGSTSYGQDFGNLIQHAYPGDDYKDLMAGVDEVLKRGYVDPARLGVTGGSGGGVLTNWTITQTTRFAAAVSQRSIADWASFWYTADFTLFHPTWFKAAPWQDPADFTARSAITHVEKIQTPLMLVEGEADYRTPPTAGGEAMFRALKYLKKPVVMVRFPDESHELSRSGKPAHRLERLRHIVNWFDVWLLGKKMDIYEVR